MVNYKMVIAYDGTKYRGWQKQGNTQDTIQGKIEGVLEKMYGEAIEIHGSGRTDGGVHAQGQVANYKCDNRFSTQEVLWNLNRHLPQDIRVLQVEEASPRFHARLNAAKKTYRYTVNTGEIHDVFMRKFETHIPKNYDIKSMQEGAKCLLGEHDFRCFCGNKRMKKSTVRRMDSIDITRQGDKIILEFTGNGFLFHMVRIMTGTLLEIGEGKKRPEDMDKILAEKNRDLAGFTAPPQGLCLQKVEY